MTKVYPNAAASNHIPPQKLEHFPEHTHNDTSFGIRKAEVLTVWKKSLLFNCDGFTVFDANGNLLFRVDNYCAATKAEIVLMDASGNPLLTIRRKRLSMSDNWSIYKGEATTNPIMSVRNIVNFLNTKSLANATIVTDGTNTSHSSSSKVAAKADTKTKLAFEIEGSYTRRCCTVYDGKRRVAAEIRQKEATTRGVAFGLDVFRLNVHPEMDSATAMALVIVLDQMFGSSKRLHFN